MAAPVETTSAAEVLLATGHSPFARGVLRRTEVRGWSRDGAVVWLGVDPEERRSYLSCLGDPPAVAALVADVLPELPPRQRITVPRGTARLLPAWVDVDGVDWDFRWTTGPGAEQPGEDRVEVLDDVAGVEPLLVASSPRASARPGDPAVRRWVGVHEQGRLVACAADTSGSPGVGHLSSIAVHPDAQGRGLGRAVTAALTRRLFAEGADVVTLGAYADNEPGRRLYESLGWPGLLLFTSGPLRVRSRW